MSQTRDTSSLPTSEVVLSIGSNESGEAGIRRVEDAIKWLARYFSSSILSSGVYTTPSISGKGEDYTNAVAVFPTVFTSEELNKALKEYEKSCGRNSESKARGEVPIDIDIVIYNGEILRPNDYSRDYFRIGYEELK